MEQRNKATEDLETRNNQFNQYDDVVDQLSNANEEIMYLRSENERLRNNLNAERQINESLQSDLRTKRQINESLENELITEKQVNERMIKSQADMNQLNQQNEQNLHRQKDKDGLGYKEEGESSKQGEQRNQRPTCITVAS